MKRLRILLSLVLFGSTSLSLYAADAASLQKEILWKTTGQQEALFVPADVLQKSIGAAPFAAQDKAYLAGRLEAAQSGTNCAPWITSHGWSSRTAPPRTLTQIMAESRSMFTAKVVAVVTGWSISHLSPVTMVWISPTERVRDADGIIAKRELFAFAIEHATLEIDGRQLCSADKAFEIPAIGQRLLVDAVQTVGDGRLLLVAHYFPVKGEEVRALPFGDVIPFQPVSLDRAVAAAKQAVRQ